MNTPPTLSPNRDNLKLFISEVRELILWCTKKKTIQPLLQYDSSTWDLMVETSFLLSEEWSNLFLSIIIQQRVNELLSLEDIVINSAHRGVLQALKNLLDTNPPSLRDSNLILYRLRRIYYNLSTYFSENEPMMGYEIDIYHPSPSFRWVSSLEDLT